MYRTSDGGLTAVKNLFYLVGVTCKRMRWAGHVSETRNTYKGKPEGKRPLARRVGVWEDIIKRDGGMGVRELALSTSG